MFSTRSALCGSRRSTGRIRSLEWKKKREKGDVGLLRGRKEGKGCHGIILATPSHVFPFRPRLGPHRWAGFAHKLPRLKHQGPISDFPWRPPSLWKHDLTLYRQEGKTKIERGKGTCLGEQRSPASTWSPFLNPSQCDCVCVSLSLSVWVLRRERTKRRGERIPTARDDDRGPTKLRQ